jgi:hypothetical protein
LFVENSNVKVAIGPAASIARKPSADLKASPTQANEDDEEVQKAENASEYGSIPPPKDEIENRTDMNKLEKGTHCHLRPTPPLAAW